MLGIQTYKKFWIGFDKHNPDNDPLVDKIVTEFLTDFKPQFRIAGGDWMSCDQISGFSNESESDLLKEFEQTERDIDRWKVTHYLEGNHEERIRRIGGQLDKRLRALADIKRNLHLADRRIPFLPYHPTGGVLEIGHLKVLHGFYCTEYLSRKMAEVYGTCVFGHAHRFQIFQPRSAFDTRVGFAIGMLGSLSQSYTENRAPMGWAQGFVFGYIHRNGWFDLYPVRINAGRVCINDKVYGTFQNNKEK
jgi:hypothetical protein